MAEAIAMTVAITFNKVMIITREFLKSSYLLKAKSVQMQISAGYVYVLEV